MDKLKVCFVGVGSIAKRHIKNLHVVCSERGIALKIDAVRRNTEAVEGIDVVYCSAAEVPDDYDAVFITNPTDCHLKTLREFHDKAKNFFIEKPVAAVSQIQEAKEFCLRDGVVYYVACPLRYHAVIQYIRNNVELDDVIAVRSISSSYLPDWRPGQGYRNTYSAHKNMGGGVSIDLIHEWDYLTYLFGQPLSVKSIIQRKSNLEIDSDDIALYIAEYPDKTVELHLDYFGRKTIREIQLFTQKDTIIGDIAKNKLSFLVSGEIIDFHEERDDYQKRELNQFVDMVMGLSCAGAENGFSHAIDVLALTQGRIKP